MMADMIRTFGPGHEKNWNLWFYENLVKYPGGRTWQSEIYDK